MNSRLYVPEIDGLRAIAVVAVITYHSAPDVLPGGFAGVDLFFVISGYVVSASLARDAGKPLHSFMLGFYVRRIVRIFPALMVCLVATAIATTLFIPEAWLSSTVQQTGRYAFVGLSNIALVQASDGYFSPRAELNPFVHTWTLGVEEQFYLIFPLIFFAWLKLIKASSPWNWVGKGLLVVLMLISLAYSAVATATSPDKAFYYLPSRFWELASGALLFQLQGVGKLSLHSPKIVNGIYAVGLLLIALSFGLPDQKPFPLPWVLLPVCGALLVIAAVTSEAPTASGLSRQLGRPAFVQVGKLSYSLYLWHWPVFVLLRWTLGLDTFGGIVLALVVTVMLSVLSYWWIENPIRRDPSLKVVPNWRVVAGGLVCMAASLTLANKIFAIHTRIGLSVTKDERAWYAKAWSEKPKPAGCKVVSTLVTREGVSESTFRRTSCNEPLPSPRRIFVVGDSHAGAYGTMLYWLTEERGTEVALFMKGGCAYLGLSRPSEPGCMEFVRTVTDEILQRAEPGDMVFLASMRVTRPDHQEAQVSGVVAATDKGLASDRGTALAEALAIVGQFDKAQLRVVFDAPKPVFKSPAFRCSDWFNSMNGVCSGGLSMDRESLLKLRQPAMQALAILSAMYPKARIWDPFPVLCPTEVCVAVDSRGPLFFDGDHLSGFGNRVLYPSFLSFLDKFSRLKD